MNSPASNSQHDSDDFGIPPDYDQTAGDHASEASSQQKKTFAYTETKARAFLNGVKLLPNGKDQYVFELSLMSGGKDDKTNYLYGSFFASKNLKRIASKLVDVDFADAGIVCKVVILNLHAEPSHGDNDRIFENNKGFLVGLAFE